MDDSEDKTNIPQGLLYDLATNELRLVGLFLASADSASRQADEKSEAVALKKAFVTFCEATVRISQMPEADRELFLQQVEEFRQRLHAAYSEDV